MPALLQPCIYFPKQVAPKLTTFCANFSRLSELLSAVNIFFAFLEFLFQVQITLNKIRKFAQRKISKHRNDRKWPRSTQLLNFNSTAVAWVWIAGQPFQALDRDQTLGLRSDFPRLRLNSTENQFLQEPRCE